MHTETIQQLRRSMKETRWFTPALKVTAIVKICIRIKQFLGPLTNYKQSSIRNGKLFIYLDFHYLCNRFWENRPKCGIQIFSFFYYNRLRGTSYFLYTVAVCLRDTKNKSLETCKESTGLHLDPFKQLCSSYIVRMEWVHGLCRLVSVLVGYGYFSHGKLIAHLKIS